MIRLDPAVSTWSPSVLKEGRPVRYADRGNTLSRCLEDQAREVIEVLIVDDDALVRALLGDILDGEDDIRVIGAAGVERRLTGHLLAEWTRLARLAEGPTCPGTSLSLRERQIVQLIAAGKTNHEIAKVLFLSPHTIKSHVSHILQKLGLPNRTEV